MITERKFLSSYSSFWRVTLPMSESFVRTINSTAVHFYDPLLSEALPKRQAFISELAFRLYISFVSGQWDMNGQIESELLTVLSTETERYVSRMERRPVFTKFDENDISESIMVARRLAYYFRYYEPRKMILPRPSFKGCGIVDDSEGDLLVGTTLYEIKNVDRDFRSTDIRQLLCYCALNAVSQQHKVRGVALLNARKGTYYMIGLNALSLATSGHPATTLLSEISDYISADRPSR